MLAFFAFLIAFLTLPDAAHAGPVFFAALSAGAGVGGAFAATALGGFLSTTVGRLLLSVAFSALQAALQEKPKPAGIVTEAALTGSTQPLSFIIGRYATAGQMQGPMRSHGNIGKVPNAYRTYIVVLSCIPGATMARLMINGEYVEIGTTPHAEYGLPILGRYTGYAWVKYYDGSQTAADPMLLAKYASDPDRPWSANMVGTGMCYAILTFAFSQSIWPSGEPSWRFEMQGIPLYDPRKDSTVGGSGSQRWNNRATWATTDNPIVQAYNIMRGIEIPGLGIWGGELPAEDLPLSYYFSCANICDQLVTRPDGATEPRFRTGYEIKVDKEPAEIIEELFKCSSTRIAEVGGAFKPRTGGPGLPVYFMTDDDIIITSPQELDPFPGSDQRYNGISTNGPNPDALWEAEPDREIYNAGWEAEDGGKRRMASLQMPACPYPLQRQRVGRAYIFDERKFIQHQMTLPPDAAILEPLDTLAWTSARNGYSTKHFELGDMQDDVTSLLQGISMREVDPTDFADPPEFGEITTPIPTTRRPIPPQLLAGFAVAAGATTDAAGNLRRPHLVLTWDGAGQEGIAGIAWEVRLSATAAHVSRGTTNNVEAGQLRVFDGILANTVYQVRAKQVAVWPVAWSGWITVNSSDVRLGSNDLADDINDAIADGVAALLEADSVRADHDALTAGFAGDLQTAFTEQAARSMATAGGWLRDPTFTDWVSGNLNINNWSSRSGTSAYCTEAGGDFGGGLTVNAPSGSASVDLIASTAPNSGLVRADATTDYVVLEMDFEYISGNPAGAVARVEWSNDGTTWTRGTFGNVTLAIGYFGSDYSIAPQAGVRQSLRALWKRPAGVSGNMRMRVTPKISTITNAQQMVIHYLNLRRATRAEIGAGETYVIASATPGQTVAYAGAGAAIAGLNSAFTARAGGLEANVTNILGARADLLTGTALASLLTQLQVASGTGLSAWVSTQGTAIAALQNKVSASYVLRVGAGGASAGLELVAQDNAVGGAASALKLSANVIGLYGDVFVSASNLFPDFDMVQDGFYLTTSSASYAFLNTGTPKLGQRYLSIDADAAAKSVYSGWFNIDPSTEYLVSGAAWMATATAGSGTSQLAFQTGEVASNGAVTVLTTSVIAVNTDAIYNASTSFSQVSVTSDATARRGRFRVLRSAGGTAAARAGAFRVEKKVGATLFAQNAVVENLLQAGEIITESMIVAGAGNRQRYFQAANMTVSGKTEGTASIVATDIAFSTDGFSFMPIRPYNPAAVSGARNPIVARIQVAVSAVVGNVKARLVCQMQYRKGGVWWNFPSVPLVFGLMANHSLPTTFSGNLTANMNTSNGGLDANTWTGLRLYAYTENIDGFTGANVTILQADILVEQISR